VVEDVHEQHRVKALIPKRDYLPVKPFHGDRCPVADEHVNAPDGKVPPPQEELVSQEGIPAAHVQNLGFSGD
jgi:hypothetical protein